MLSEVKRLYSIAQAGRFRRMARQAGGRGQSQPLASAVPPLLLDPKRAHARVMGLGHGNFTYLVWRSSVL